MRLDLSVNLLTMAALKNGRITVFGGKQTRPNIHIKDMVRVYQHFLAKGTTLSGCFNAGFENLAIMEIANRVADVLPAEIIVTPSNDPRSYRLCSDKLLKTGFAPEYTVSDGMKEVIDAHEKGLLPDEDRFYNLKTMKKIEGLG
jgi:nucleoside-diphosphate-sugar epimerase